jgi:hypothetical protein
MWVGVGAGVGAGMGGGGEWLQCRDSSKTEAASAKDA